MLGPSILKHYFVAGSLQIFKTFQVSRHSLCHLTVVQGIHWQHGSPLLCCSCAVSAGSLSDKSATFPHWIQVILASQVADVTPEGKRLCQIEEYFAPYAKYAFPTTFPYVWHNWWSRWRKKWTDHYIGCHISHLLCGLQAQDTQLTGPTKWPTVLCMKQLSQCTMYRMSK